MVQSSTHTLSLILSLGLSLGLAGVTAGCSPSLSAASPSEAVEAQASVDRVVADVAHHIDAKRWDALQALFAPEVQTDYTSLFGGKPQQQSNEALINTWKGVLSAVTTQHHLGPINVTVEGTSARAHCNVRGHHYVESAAGGPTWMVAGTYDFELTQSEGRWLISKMTLNTLYQTGNRQLLSQAAKAKKTIGMNQTKIQFESGGEKVVGDLYLPAAKEKPPVVVVAGSWTTVKEQMAGTYAAKLAEAGFAALAIDARGYGESGGAPRYFESPDRKIEDYKNAIAHLEGLDSVDGSRIGAVGICAGAGYIAEATADNDSVNAMGLVASWLHDEKAVEAVYGGAAGVSEKLAAAKAAKAKYQTDGFVQYIPTISETDQSAAMFGPFTYYLDEQRGAIPEWSRQFAVMSWHDWLTFNPLGSAKRVSAPTLMVHSDDAVLPDYVKAFYGDLASEKKRLHWTQGSQFDFYDQPKQVDEAVDELVVHFREHL